MRLFYIMLLKINDTFDEEDKMNYIGILYETNEQPGSIPYPNQKKIKYISAKESKDVEEITDDDILELKIKKNSQRYFLPIITFNTNKNIQRDVFIVFGASGSGKSVFINFLAMLHSKLQPTQKILFFTNNNYKIDTSLSHELYEFVDLEEMLHDIDIKEFQTSNQYDNTLLIFDDCDLDHDMDLKRKYYNFLSVLLKFKRKNRINLIISCHDESSGRWSKLLFIEMTNYVFFNNSLKNRSNIILKDYLKLTSLEIKELTTSNKSWIVINTKKKTVITPKKIYTLE